MKQIKKSHLTVIIFLCVFLILVFGITKNPSNDFEKYKGIKLEKIKEYVKDQKPIILYGFSTWCSSCKVNYSIFQDSDVKQRYIIIGLPLDDSAAAIVRHQEQYPDIFTSIILDEDERDYFINLLKINAMPVTFIIDEEGTITYSNTGKIFKNEILNAIK